MRPRSCFPRAAPSRSAASCSKPAALGVPIAAMDTGGTRDIIEHERTGLLSSTAEGLAADLSRLLGDPALASRLGAGAQAHVTSTFDASAVVSRIEALYQDVMASQRSGADRG